MNRRATAAAILLAIPCRAVGSHATQAPPVFSAEVELVRVEVSVTKDGAALPGLSAANFVVRDTGVRQALNPILLEQVPLDVVLALDVSMSVHGPRLESLRDAAQAFLEGLTAEDRAGLVAFSHQARRLQPLAADTALVRDSIRELQAQGSTSLRDAVFALLGSREPDERRAAAVVLTDGIDTTSWLRAQDVLETAKRSDVVLYVVLARPEEPRRGASSLASPTQRDLDFVREVSRATGGRIWEVRRDQDLKASFLEVLRHIRSRYLLTYNPAGVDRDGWHALDVRLVGARGDVLARPGYYRALRRR